MDLSKLPRLSKISDHTEPSREMPPDAAVPPRRETPGYGGGRSPAPENDAPFLIEAWVSICLGIILLLCFPTMTAFVASKLFHTHFGPYAAFDSAGNAIADKDGKQQTSDLVTLKDALDNVTQIPYATTKPDVSPNFYYDLVLSLFALAMIAEGFALVRSRHPNVIRAAIAVTVLATLANLVFVVVVAQKYGIIQTFYALGGVVAIPIAPLAVVIGGYMVFSEMTLLKWRLAQAGYARESIANASVSQADPARDLVQKMLGGETKPRCTHYKFAHQALRQAATENPNRCLGLLQSAGAQPFLDELWQAVRSGCESAGQGADSASNGLSAEMTQIGPYSAAIVTLPAPKAASEAHFIAIVLRSFVRESDGLTITNHPLMLYYTLERSGGDTDGPPVTQIGQWEGTTHLSHGSGPNPTASAFRDAIRGRIEQLEARENGGGGMTGRRAAGE